MLAAFAYWIPEHEAETEAAAGEPISVLVLGRRNIDVSDPPPAARGGVSTGRYTPPRAAMRTTGC